MCHKTLTPKSSRQFSPNKLIIINNSDQSGRVSDMLISIEYKLYRHNKTHSHLNKCLQDVYIVFENPFAKQQMLADKN